jgi:hypothetical protein
MCESVDLNYVAEDKFQWSSFAKSKIKLLVS